MSFVHETAIVDDDVQIGSGSKVWAFTHISKGVQIGEGCVIGEGVHIGPDVVIGDNVKIQNGSQIYHGVTIEDDVFIGPCVVTTNDIRPKAVGDWGDRFRKTLICKGASVGANATIICGVYIGRDALVGAGSVVTRDVQDKWVVYGNPAKRACSCK